MIQELLLSKMSENATDSIKKEFEYFRLWSELHKTQGHDLKIQFFYLWIIFKTKQKPSTRIHVLTQELQLCKMLEHATDRIKIEFD